MGFIITKVEKRNRKNFIDVNDQFMFALYDKELGKYNIVLDYELDANTLEKILQVQKKRGKQYIYHLLSKKDYTRHEIIEKLSKSGYAQDTIRKVLEDIDRYNLISDRDYARRYIEQKIRKQSKMQIQYTLLRKGIDLSLIHELMETLKLSEYDAIVKILSKRVKKVPLSFLEEQKMYQYLQRKGFQIDQIRYAMQKFVGENK